METPFFNRELSWIAFNERVLWAAEREDLPLLERLKFLCIVAANFDEFFMVRVAGLKRQRRGEGYVSDPAGLSPETQLKRISEEVHRIVERKHRFLHDKLLPQLRREGLALKDPSEWSATQRTFTKERFDREVAPVLTPVRCAPGEELRLSGNMRLHGAFLLEEEGNSAGPLDQGDRGEEPALAIVQLPPSLERILYLPEKDNSVSFTLLDHLVAHYGGSLFPGYRVIESAVFRVVRDADLGVDEDRDEDFVQAMEQVLEHREHSAAIRLAVSENTELLTERLRVSLGLEPWEVYEKPNPLDLASLMPLTTIAGFEHLRQEPWPPFAPRSLAEEESLWDAIRRRDVLLHHPYESFEPVIRLLQEAARDAGVLAIKMTLYRTSGDSPVIRALESAAEAGKQVTVLVELKARFDEERNIGWAQRLERAGVIVIYGIARLKVHAKALLIVRREPDGIRRYVHLGTGNYNDKTARLYTDFGYFSCRDDLAYEVGVFFNAITGYSAIPNLSKLSMAPTGLKSKLLQMISREAKRAESGEQGLIHAKLNSLADPQVITALYEASRQGVKIELNIRGICMLVPGVPGQSDNIRVTSIVDRFLEHARVYYFRNGGAEEVYCASADWMPRNLDRRVELAFPIEEPAEKRRIIEAFGVFFRDNQNAYELDRTGAYHPVEPGPGEEPLRAQEYFYARARAAAEESAEASKKEFTVRRKAPEPPGSDPGRR